MPGLGFAFAVNDSQGSWAEPHAPCASHPARGPEQVGTSALLRMGWYIHAPCQSLWVPPILGVLLEVRPEPSAYVNAFLTRRMQSYAACAVPHPTDTQILSTRTAHRRLTALQLSTSVAIGKLSVSLVFPRKAACTDPA